MPSPGRSSACSRSSAIASPKCRNRPPLQVPIALRPGSLTDRPSGPRRGSGVGVIVERRGVLAVGAVLAVALLGADPDRLRLGLGHRFLLRLLLRGDDLQAQRFVLLVPRGIAFD